MQCLVDLTGHRTCRKGVALCFKLPNENHSFSYFTARKRVRVCSGLLTQSSPTHVARPLTRPGYARPPSRIHIVDSQNAMSHDTLLPPIPFIGVFLSPIRQSTGLIDSRFRVSLASRWPWGIRRFRQLPSPSAYLASPLAVGLISRYVWRNSYTVRHVFVCAVFLAYRLGS